MLFLSGSCGHDTVYVVNNENETLKMSVDESSLIEPDTGESVAFTPKIASLPPKSRLNIELLCSSYKMGPTFLEGASIFWAQAIIGTPCN